MQLWRLSLCTGNQSLLVSSRTSPASHIEAFHYSTSNVDGFTDVTLKMGMPEFMTHFEAWGINRAISVAGSAHKTYDLMKVKVGTLLLAQLCSVSGYPKVKMNYVRYLEMTSIAYGVDLKYWPLKAMANLTKLSWEAVRKLHTCLTADPPTTYFIKLKQSGVNA
ncbi:hypothetical protein FRB95_010051 [Tulasnella sp. JGI-2019a]|nr:hypothetical protein FRB95_010051 [Tulasnella sp. JGI-2019a]